MFNDVLARERDDTGIFGERDRTSSTISGRDTTTGDVGDSQGVGKADQIRLPPSAIREDFRPHGIDEISGHQSISSESAIPERGQPGGRAETNNDEGH